MGWATSTAIHSPAGLLESPYDIGRCYVWRKSLLDSFWSVWTPDYIRSFSPWCGSSGRGDLKKCSRVLVQDLQKSRFKWSLRV